MTRGDIKPASYGRRVGAHLLDFGFGVALAFLLFFTLGMRAIIPGCGYYDATNILIGMGKDSTLYSVEGEEGSTQTATLFREQTYDVYETKVRYYYCEWLPECTYAIDPPAANDEGITEYGIDYYNQVILGLTKEQNASGTYGNQYYTWDLDENDEIDYTKPAVLNVNPAAAGMADTLKNYYFDEDNSTGLYVDAVYNLQGQTVYRAANQTTSDAISIALVPTILIPAFLFFFLIPAFLKNGKTLGKLIFGIGVIGQDGYSLPFYRLWVRQLFFVALYGLLTIPVYSTLFMILALALLIGDFFTMLFSKNMVALHDRIARTQVIDVKHSTWFVDKAAEEKYFAEHPDSTLGLEDALEDLEAVDSAPEADKASIDGSIDDVEPEELEELSSLDGGDSPAEEIPSDEGPSKED